MKKNGYIALTVVVILFFLIMTIGIVSSFGSISKLQQTQSSTDNLTGTIDVESCAEEALLKLNLEDQLPSSFDMPEGTTCTVEVENQDGNEWTFAVSNGVKNLRIIAVRSDQVYISSWEVF